MYGTFGGYTRWAVVFLIIFVLFFLLVPAYGALTGAGTGVAMTSYPMSTWGMGTMGSAYGYDSSSSS
ncbi:hypothetical protein JI721_01750 [Alicyclobacillus cycloheptanicus]|uniref:Membrane protein DedA with SNARE-associated domain n=1 Tax=Alicyclobacillus cycloheptanicus TaxID=1457 RepID=A0ABT9XGY4_9BACL|nr:hypothetical protein [Alicyclobacillus cycloheptanicus]MDQ0189563.1 membrane protein DedA with SNARE-associated domain [Alicyclobacillus cycloheptanicus]WDM03121.1 hypothetical protein JI721_01750 [Alicyclobacillus cycloheptanicus]